MTRRNSSDAIMECLNGYVFLSLCLKYWPYVISICLLSRYFHCFLQIPGLTIFLSSENVALYTSFSEQAGEYICLFP